MIYEHRHSVAGLSSYDLLKFKKKNIASVQIEPQNKTLPIGALMPWLAGKCKESAMIVLLLLLHTATELSLGGSSPYTGADRTDENKCVDKKNQLDVTFCILYFSCNSCSTCFGQPCAHHQELTTA